MCLESLFCGLLIHVGDEEAGTSLPLPPREEVHWVWPEGEIKVSWLPLEQRDDGEWFGMLSIVYRAKWVRPDSPILSYISNEPVVTGGEKQKTPQPGDETKLGQIELSTCILRQIPGR